MSGLRTMEVIVLVSSPEEDVALRKFLTWSGRENWVSAGVFRRLALIFSGERVQVTFLDGRSVLFLQQGRTLFLRDQESEGQQCAD